MACPLYNWYSAKDIIYAQTCERERPSERQNIQLQTFASKLWPRRRLGKSFEADTELLLSMRLIIQRPQIILTGLQYGGCNFTTISNDTKCGTFYILFQNSPWTIDRSLTDTWLSLIYLASLQIKRHLECNEGNVIFDWRGRLFILIGCELTVIEWIGEKARQMFWQRESFKYFNDTQFEYFFFAELLPREYPCSDFIARSNL